MNITKRQPTIAELGNAVQTKRELERQERKLKKSIADCTNKLTELELRRDRAKILTDKHHDEVDLLNRVISNYEIDGADGEQLTRNCRIATLKYRSTEQELNDLNSSMTLQSELIEQSRLELTTRQQQLKDEDLVALCAVWCKQTDGATASLGKSAASLVGFLAIMITIAFTPISQAVSLEQWDHILLIGVFLTLVPMAWSIYRGWSLVDATRTASRAITRGR